VNADHFYFELEQQLRDRYGNMSYISYNDDAEHMPSERINHLDNFARTCKLFSLTTHPTLLKPIPSSSQSAPTAWLSKAIAMEPLGMLTKDHVREATDIC
jgi:hypothetical protein